MPKPPINQHELEYLYHNNAARHLDNISDDFHRRLRNKLVAQGYKGLKLSFSSVMSYMSFSGTRLVDIAEKRGMTKQAIGQLANEIEELGYIERVPDPHDGRAKNLVFTELGTQLIRDSIEAVKEVEKEYAKVLGNENAKQLGTLLAELSVKLGEKSSI
jgi:DNA-binding MarR family transcriptional regulator